MRGFPQLGAVSSVGRASRLHREATLRNDELSSIHGGTEGEFASNRACAADHLRTTCRPILVIQGPPSQKLEPPANPGVVQIHWPLTQHRVKLHSTNPLERLDTEVRRRADVVGIFPNEDSIVRLTMTRGPTRFTPP